MPIFPAALACWASRRCSPPGCMSVTVCVLCRAAGTPTRGLVVDGLLLEVCPLCYALESCRALLARLELGPEDRGVVEASLTELHTFLVDVEERHASQGRST